MARAGKTLQLRLIAKLEEEATLQRRRGLFNTSVVRFNLQEHLQQNIFSKGLLGGLSYF